MRKAPFSETQIVQILNEADAGTPVKEICRKHGISYATYYNWKSKYGGMEASDLKRMKELERELSQFKSMYADMALENRAMKDQIEKKSFRAARETGSLRYNPKRRHGNNQNLSAIEYEKSYIRKLESVWKNVGDSGRDSICFY